MSLENYVIFTGNESIGKNNVSLIDKNTLKFSFPCFNTVNCAPYKLRVRKGIYYFEVAGASGGYIVEGIGGKGGISKGVYAIPQSTTLYVYVGGSGESTPERIVTKANNGGFNGGAKGGQDRGGGGGATDIRTQFGDTEEQLKSRLIVAGGGGGGHYDSDQNVNSGRDGGGINGTSGGRSGSGRLACYGSFNASICPTIFDERSGSFGFGYWGGGGGWWGGGSVSGCGGGGSGYLGNPINSYQKITSTNVGANEGNGYAIISLIKIIGQTSQRPISFVHFKIFSCIFLDLS